MRLSWSELLIEDITLEQLQAWLLDWRGVVKGPISPIFLNMFGMLCFLRPDGTVDLLNVLSGEVERAAETGDAFRARMNDVSFQETYLLSELVYRLHEAGKTPGPGQCYAFTPHPVFTGKSPFTDEYDPRFIMVMEIRLWMSMCAQATHPSSRSM